MSRKPRCVRLRLPQKLRRACGASSALIVEGAENVGYYVRDFFFGALSVGVLTVSDIYTACARAVAKVSYRAGFLHTR